LDIIWCFSRSGKNFTALINKKYLFVELLGAVSHNSLKTSS
jgi:hypothetical protein